MDENSKFPKLNISKEIDEQGFVILTDLFAKDFGWRCRKNHLEDDFGIDGYIDIITNNKQITGKSIAFQLKTGKSYLNEENEIGYVFRGKIHHLNYYLNSNIPVIVILLDKDKKEAFWEIVTPENAEQAGNNWKMTIPKNKKILNQSKNELEKHIGPITDYISQLEEVWKFNNLLKEHDIILINVPKKDVDNKNLKPILKVLEKFVSTKDLILNLKNKIDISFDDYENDERELFEITEVNEWITKLFRSCKFLPYLLIFNKIGGFAKLLLFSQIKIISKTEQNGQNMIEFEPENFNIFIKELFLNLNEFCKENNLSENTIKEISKMINSFYRNN